MSDQPGTSADKGRIGLIPATALVVGSIVGTGIFLLPRSLAPYGSIALVAFALAAVGAIFLALMFGALSRRMPADGGPYAYARAAFGNAAGFSSAWSYWITAWAGNSAIVVAWVAYVEVFVNTSGARTISIVVGLVGLWIPAVINLLGVQQMALVQVVTTILKFIPLVIISTVGLFSIDWSMLKPFNLTGGSPLSAIVTTMALAVFSFLGVETASVAAGKVRNPTRNVPRASLLGTLAAAVVYILSTLVIFGTVPNKELQDPTAQPFVQSFNAMFGGSWAGYAVAVAAIISGFGALNGWTMICAEMPLAAAREGLFPKKFATISGRGVPAYGIIASTVLASVLMVVAYMGQEGAGVFNVMILLSGLTAAVPYLFSALALMRWSARSAERRTGANWVWEGAIATIGMAFSALIIYGSFTDAGTREQLIAMTVVVFVIGLVMYLFMRRHLSDDEAPATQEVTP